MAYVQGQRGKGSQSGGEGKGDALWNGKRPRGKDKGNHIIWKIAFKGTRTWKGKPMFHGMCNLCGGQGHSQNWCPHRYVAQEDAQTGEGLGECILHDANWWKITLRRII